MREGAGVFVILAGIVVIIGAARGTWKQLWSDVTGAPVPGSGSSSPVPGTPGFIQGLPGIIQNIPLSPFGPLGPTIGNPAGVTPGIAGAIGLTGNIANAYTQPHVIPYYPGPGANGAGAVAVQ